MPIYCDVKLCYNNKYLKNPEIQSQEQITFFALPKKEELRQKWLDFIQAKNPRRRDFRICSVHFESKYIWKKHPRCLLTHNAVPTLNGPSISKDRQHEDQDPRMQSEDLQLSASNSSSLVPGGPTSRCQKDDASIILQKDNDICGTPVKEMKCGHRRNTILQPFSMSKRSPKTLRRLQIQKRTICKLRSRYQRLQQRKRNIECKQALTNIVENYSSGLPKATKVLLGAQLRLGNINKYGRRYDNSLKDLALSIYYHSPKAYKFLRSFLTLPTPRTLRTYQSTFPIKAGINHQVLINLQEKFANERIENKVVSLLFDEIKLEPEIHFSPSHDEFIGLADDGTQKDNRVAKSALVCVMTWINMNAKQIIGHWFLPSTGCSEQTHSIIISSVKTVFDIGLIVKTIIFDQGPRNIGFLKKFDISIQKPYLELGDHKIFVMFDPPHLLKSLRNNLKNRPLIYCGVPIDWNDIVSIYNLGKNHEINLIPKISKKHFELTHYSKMRVSLAAQIFSYTMHIALICFKRMFPENFDPNTQTEKLILDMDKLFDALNSSLKNKTVPNKLNYAISDNTEHIEFLKQMAKNFETIKFSRGTRPPCLNGWVLTINSVILLFEDLKSNYNIPQLLTRRLNQDALENLFATIRQQHGCSLNPSPLQFQAGLRHILITQLSKLSKNSNCEVDDFIYCQLSKIKQLPKPVIHNYPEIEVTIPETPSHSEMPEIEEFGVTNSIYYISGYLIKKFLDHHKCDDCTKILSCNDNVDFKAHRAFTYLKTYDDTSCLNFATEEVYEIVTKWEEKFSVCIDGILNSKRISYIMSEIFKNACPTLQLCGPESTEQFLKTFIRIRCHWHARYLRRMMTVAVQSNKKYKKFLS